MTLLVDTSVWSLALRRDTERTEPEVRQPKDELLGSEVVVTTGRASHQPDAAGQQRLHHALLELAYLPEGAFADRAPAPRGESQAGRRSAASPCRARDRHAGLPARELASGPTATSVRTSPLHSLHPPHPLHPLTR